MRDIVISTFTPGYPYGVETRAAGYRHGISTRGKVTDQRGTVRLHAPFETQAEAIEYAQELVKTDEYDYVKVVKIETPAAGPTWSSQHGWNK